MRILNNRKGVIAMDYTFTNSHLYTAKYIEVTFQVDIGNSKAGQGTGFMTVG
jgi:hypothetical protein